ncbi:MAG: DoxX family protein [Paracoccaceae bacterium]
MISLHRAIFGWFQRLFEDWLLGLAARFAFASVLFMYFWQSFQRKVGEIPGDVMTVQDNAFVQILGDPVMSQADYVASNIDVWPWHYLVYLGTYGEIVLPALIIVGLLTRIAAIGMIIFVAVQTYVDINGFLIPPQVVLGPEAEPAPEGIGAGPETIGMIFDRFPDAAIADQRMLWLFPLLYLVFRGPGYISLDYLLGGGTTRDDKDDDDDYYA